MTLSLNIHASFLFAVLGQWNQSLCSEEELVFVEGE